MKMLQVEAIKLWDYSIASAEGKRAAHYRFAAGSLRYSLPSETATYSCGLLGR